MKTRTAEQLIEVLNILARGPRNELAYKQLIDKIGNLAVALIDESELDEHNHSRTISRGE